jgi:hypothetical protein
MSNDSKYELFEKDGKIVKIKKECYESREHFLTRVYFILDNLDSNEMDEIVNLSFLFLNTKYLGNKYDSKITNHLDNYVCRVI